MSKAGCAGMSLFGSNGDTIQFFLKQSCLYSHFSQADLVKTVMAAVYDCQRRHPRAPRKQPIRRHASYTVEASIVMPIFVFTCACILLFFRVLAVEWGVSVALNETAREAALYGGSWTVQEHDMADTGQEPLSAVDDVQNAMGHDASEKGQKDAKLTVMATTLARARILTEKVPLQFIRFQAVGLDFSDSCVDDKDIDLVVSYVIPMPVRFFGIDRMKVTQRAKAHRWVGFDPSEGIGQEGSLVYVTEYGTAYHRSRGCSYLNPSIKAVAKAGVDQKRNSSGHKYYSCPLCGGNASTVYITTYGEHYHSNIGCSGLKRTIRAITQQEATAEGFHACGKCAK